WCARKTRLFSPFGPWLKYGLTYSQTNSPSGVTSKRRPKSDSQIKVLPFGNRCAFDRRGLKNSYSRRSWYFQTICLVANSTSITRENGIEWSNRCGPLSKSKRLPLESGVGACCPDKGGAPRLQITFPC